MISWYLLKGEKCNFSNNKCKNNDCFQTSFECQPKVRQTDSLDLKLMSLVEPMLLSQAEENTQWKRNALKTPQGLHFFFFFLEINLQMACLQLYLHFKGATNDFRNIMHKICPTWQIRLKNVSLEITPVTALGSIQSEGAGPNIWTYQKTTWSGGVGFKWTKWLKKSSIHHQREVCHCHRNIELQHSDLNIEAKKCLKNQTKQIYFMLILRENNLAYLMSFFKDKLAVSGLNIKTKNKLLFYCSPGLDMIAYLLRLNENQL